MTTEADEEDDGMSDIIQEVGNSTVNLSLMFFFLCVSHELTHPGDWTDLESGSESPGGQEAPAEFQTS